MSMMRNAIEQERQQMNVRARKLRIRSSPSKGGPLFLSPPTSELFSVASHRTGPSQRSDFGDDDEQRKRERIEARSASPPGVLTDATGK